MSEQQRILIVDDNPDNIKIVASSLRSTNLELAFALSGDEALKRLENSIFDLVLMDVMMPEMDGFETVSAIRKKPEYSDVPIIFLTAMNDEESIEKAFEIGAADYLSKPFRPRELEVRVNYQLERQQFIKQLEYLASRDMLTGVYNRRKFFQLGEARMAQSPSGLVVLMIDVDHFKEVNDEYGHHVGDLVLKSLASTIQSELPDDAIFGRLGGEEFAAIFSVSDLESAYKFAETIRQRVAETKIDGPDGEKPHCTVSIGIGMYQDTDSLDALLKVADEMLYRAKEGGRNRTIIRAQ